MDNLEKSRGYTLYGAAVFTIKRFLIYYSNIYPCQNLKSLTVNQILSKKISYH